MRKLNQILAATTGTADGIPSDILVNKAGVQSDIVVVASDISVIYGIVQQIQSDVVSLISDVLART